jgi:hypothetical protein
MRKRGLTAGCSARDFVRVAYGLHNKTKHRKHSDCNDRPAQQASSFQRSHQAMMPSAWMRQLIWIKKELHRSQRRTRRSRSALLTTDTELIAMAAPAKIGDRSTPNTGYSTPAAMGTPSAL